MTKDSAHAASGVGRAGHPTGFRRLTPGLLKTDRTAASFAGLPDGVTMHGQLLAAFKAAAPRLGLSPRVVHALDWLFRFTQPQDWRRGGRPIVWPSAATQQEALGLSATRVKAINRALIEAGLVAMRDSPNGKRYGKRDPQGRIVEAYGFDLAPIAMRHAEFVQLAWEAREERDQVRRLRRRASIARNGIAQILETATEYGFQGEEWLTLAREAGHLARSAKAVELPAQLAEVVDKLELRQHLARERLEALLAGMASLSLKPVNQAPLGPENGPHQYIYKPDSYPEQDTVTAREDRRSRGGEGGAPAPTTGRREPEEKGRVLRLHPDELVRLAPRLKPYLRRGDPSWSDLVDAASFLRSDLDVSRSLWGEACLAMGREQAAVAIAIVSTKEPGHFRTSAGGYFHGMVAKARAGDLNLERTLWGLRGAKQPKAPAKAGDGQGRGPSQALSRLWR